MHTQAPTDTSTPRHMLLMALEVEARKTSTQAATYEPRFDVIAGDGGHWVRDHGRPIAWIHGQRHMLDAFEFSPFSTLGREPVIDRRYDMGTYINMHATLLHPSAGGLFGTNSGTVSGPQWDVDTTRAVRLRLTGDYEDRTHVECELTIGYDAATGQYLYRLHKAVDRAEPMRHEFCNVYPRELGNGMPRDKKWQHTVWQDPDGRLRRFAHTPALTCLLDRQGERLGRKAIAPDGFIGWGTEPELNLVVLFEQTDAPLVSGTCDQWYDEHLCFDEAGLAQRGGRATVTFRLLNAPAKAMRRLIEQAEAICVPEEEIVQYGGPAFIPDRINDLEQLMDPHAPQAGQVWRLGPTAPGHVRVTRPDDAPGHNGDEYEEKAELAPLAEHVAWADDCAHSGERSIRVRGMTDRLIWLTPMGPNLRTKANTRYRFEGWIKTRGAGARLWLGRIWHSWARFHGTAHSATVEPDSDWTHVSVELDNTDLPYMLCRLCVEGAGEAWFDDLRFTELAPVPASPIALGMPSRNERRRPAHS